MKLLVFGEGLNLEFIITKCLYFMLLWTTFKLFELVGEFAS
jgi:hypothetical protein